MKKRFIADFHVHSHHSLATSPLLVPEYLDYWARLKGVGLVGCGDLTHPSWRRELQEKLEPVESGLYKLKNSYRKYPPFSSSWFEESEVCFILTGEVSTIYKKQGKVHKIHNLIFVPDLTTVEAIQKELIRLKVNIFSDGRPILGMDCRDLLELVLQVSAGKAFWVPAHIWTPWFSVLGDKSGFDSLPECFADLSSHIRAVETGLSSDPPMNWLCSALDSYTLISNSDAHSPEKIGREANIFATPLNYAAIVSAMSSGHHEEFLGTVEFFPQEGKYHLDGHRRCGVRWDPRQTAQNRGICPVCQKSVTVGVLNRVQQLADRRDGERRPNRHPFYPVIALKEILGEIVGLKPESRKITEVYLSLLKKLGPELNILLDLPLTEIQKSAGDELAEALKRMRENRVIIEEGYDGEYGRIRVFHDNELGFTANQQVLFADWEPLTSGDKPVSLKRRKEKAGRLSVVESSLESVESSFVEKPDMLNAQQEASIAHHHGPVLILAGPGTGKTRVLASRIGSLLDNGPTLSGQVLAVTFSNKAALEMRTRFRELFQDRLPAEAVSVSTFHSFGLQILKAHQEKFGRTAHFSLLDESDRLRILLDFLKIDKKEAPLLASQIASMKQGRMPLAEIGAEPFRSRYDRYEGILIELNAFDLDDLVSAPCRLLTENPDLALFYQQRYPYILVDECQDMNAAQFHLLKILEPPPAGNLCLIGDPNQAIYGFRGAEVGLISQFLSDYPQAVVFRLDQSYRCSNYILKSSADIIGPSDDNLLVLKGWQQGVKIVIVKNQTHRSEAEWIARTIEEMMGGVSFFSIDTRIANGQKVSGIEGFGDFAVLCRIAEQIKPLAEAFNQHGIPFQTAEEMPFFKKEPFAILLDVLRYALNQNNRYLKRKIEDHDVSGSFSSAKFQGMLNELQSLAEVKQKILFLADRLALTQNQEIKQDLENLIGLTSHTGGDIAEFVTQVMLGRGSDTLRTGLEQAALLTIHAAKGLEFSCVFIPGCEEGLIPYSLFPGQHVDAEEERRLLYVGMTRASRYLFLSHAEKREMFGRTFRLGPSTFLKRIASDLSKRFDAELPRKKEGELRQRKLFETE